MFDDSRITQRVQRLIALPGLHDNAIVRSSAELMEAQPCSDVIRKKNIFGYYRPIEKKSENFAEEVKAQMGQV